MDRIAAIHPTKSIQGYFKYTMVKKRVWIVVYSTLDTKVRMTYVMLEVTIIVIRRSTIRQGVTVVNFLWRLIDNFRWAPIFVFVGYTDHLNLKGKLELFRMGADSVARK